MLYGSSNVIQIGWMLVFINITLCIIIYMQSLLLKTTRMQVNLLQELLIVTKENTKLKL